MRSKVVRFLKVTMISLIVVTVAALLAMTVAGPEIRAQAKEQISILPNFADEPHVVAYNQHNLIRFHVIANSDSDRDQALKRRVRDLVVQRMAPEFSKANNLNQARKIARTHLEEIKQIARKEVKQWGKDYPVSVQLGNFDFPVKTYGDLTLPAGNYEAVKVVIGEGQGANWWCVLFPPLCFVDVSKAMTPESTENVEQLVIENRPEEDAKVSEVVYEPQDLETSSDVSSSLTEAESDNEKFAIRPEPESNNEKFVIRFKILEFFGW